MQETPAESPVEGRTLPAEPESFFNTLVRYRDPLGAKKGRNDFPTPRRDERNDGFIAIVKGNPLVQELEQGKGVLKRKTPTVLLVQVTVFVEENHHLKNS